MREALEASGNRIRFIEGADRGKLQHQLHGARPLPQVDVQPAELGLCDGRSGAVHVSCPHTNCHALQRVLYPRT